MHEQQLIYSKRPAELVPSERLNIYIAAACLSHTNFEILARPGQPYPDTEDIQAIVPPKQFLVRIALNDPTSKLAEFYSKVDFLDEFLKEDGRFSRRKLSHAYIK